MCWLPKGLWDYVFGDEVRPVTVAPGTPARGEGRGAQVVVAGPTLEPKRWDTKDAQAMAVIALTIKRSITPHIRSCRTLHNAWEILQSMFSSKNDARIQFLRKQFDKLEMQESDNMVEHLTKIKDL